jgi:hypothetical protein
MAVATAAAVLAAVLVVFAVMAVRMQHLTVSLRPCMTGLLSAPRR